MANELVLRAASGLRFGFDAGALCLELLYTGGDGQLARYEMLHEPADLARWLPRSRFGRAEFEISAAQLEQVRSLRNTLWRAATDRAHRRPIRRADRDQINAFAAEATPIPRLTDRGRSALAAPVTGSQVASAIARDAVALFAGPYRNRVRVCAAEDCQLLFVDTSRPGGRRWCSMQRCGNRAKQRARAAR